MPRLTPAGWARRACLGFLALACARMGPPPGGPPDFTPPSLLATTPESLSVLPGFDDWVSFQFDEIISEGGTPNFGTGRGALEQLVIISPDSGIPRLRWKRSRIEVQPRLGWRPNTVYRIEFDQGLSDLSRNTVTDPIVLTFTTGAPRPTRFLTGRAVDWVNRHFIPRALVIATYPADSLKYRTRADSAGRFHFGPLPEGEVLVSVSIEDGRSDRFLNPTAEAWDTVRITAGVDSVGEIWAFSRDTLPPRLGRTGATRRDSFSIALELSHPIEPSLRLGSGDVAIFIAPDSTPVPVAAALPVAAYDSIYGPIDSARRAQGAALREAAQRDSLLRIRADSLGISLQALDSIIKDSLARQPTPTPPTAPVPAADTTQPEGPQQNRPPLGNRLVIRLNAAIQPGTRYLIELRGVRAASGQVADTLRTQLIIPPEPEPPADSVAADSVATDSAAVDSPPTVLPDSTRPLVPARDSTAQPDARGVALPGRPW